MPIDPKEAQESVAMKLPEIDAADEELMNAEVSVRQAIDELVKSLEDVEECLNANRYEGASNLGYRPVSSAFVYVQRTLAGLNSAEMRKVVIVQDLAQTLDCAYEDIAPYVEAKMSSMQPRTPVTLEDAGEYLASTAKFRAQFGADGEWLDNDDEDTAEVAPRARDVARAVGFGHYGYRKAIALHHASQSQAQAHVSPMSLPSETWERIERESSRLGVSGSELIEAAISSWLDTNPESARVKLSPG